jgi:hypothetical protein
MYHWAGQKQFPTVITIFSAPNYCDFYNNKGAVIKFKVRFCLMAEQHIGHSAIFIKPAPLHFAKLFRLIFMVDSLRSIEDHINVVPLDKAGPEDRRERYRANITD